MNSGELLGVDCLALASTNAWTDSHQAVDGVFRNRGRSSRLGLGLINIDLKQPVLTRVWEAVGSEHWIAIYRWNLNYCALEDVTREFN